MILKIKMTNFNFQKIISDYFFRKYIKPKAITILQNTVINRIFLCSYWTKINENYINSFSPSCIVYAEHEIVKDIPKMKQFWVYTHFNLLGGESANYFSKLAKEINKDLQVYNYLENMSEDVKFFASRNDIASWFFRIIYKDKIVCYSLHATTSNILTEEEIKNRELENYLYEIANIIENKINSQKKKYILF